MTELKDRLDEFRVRHLDLDPDKLIEERGVHQPHLTLWLDEDADTGTPRVVLTVQAMVGQQQRFIELTPTDARELASILVGAARDAERVAGEVAAGTVKSDGGSPADQACAELTARSAT